MACGLGAVALMFVFIKESTFSPMNKDFTTELNDTNKSINEININLDLKNKELLRIIEEKNNQISSVDQIEIKTNIVNKQIEKLSKSNKELMSTLKDLETIVESKYQPSKKEYISGCNVNGRKIIFLLDTSKSMLAKELINILEISIQSDPEKNKSLKWKQGKDTLRWLIENTPETSEILIAGFNTDLYIDVKEGVWTKISDEVSIQRQLINLFGSPPDKGTNLQKAISRLKAWENADSIYLITDGLPTQSMENKSSIKISNCLNDDYVSGSCRLSFFKEFKKELYSLSSKIRLNTILLPMKGDPDAPYHFSLLSTKSKGCFMTPSKNWP
jgi:hypothetical protein